MRQQQQGKAVRPARNSQREALVCRPEFVRILAETRD
jgi:hypothetical protein